MVKAVRSQNELEITESEDRESQLGSGSGKSINLMFRWIELRRRKRQAST